MEAPSAGAVVLISFPFSDLSRSKLRPAVVLASVSRGDYVLCQVTSNPYADPNAVELKEEDFREGSLQRVSYYSVTDQCSSNACAPNVPRITHPLVIASGAKRPDHREEVLLGCNLLAVRLDAAVQSTA